MTRSYYVVTDGRAGAYNPVPHIHTPAVRQICVFTHLLLDHHGRTYKNDQGWLVRNLRSLTGLLKRGNIWMHLQTDRPSHFDARTHQKMIRDGLGVIWDNQQY